MAPQNDYGNVASPQFQEQAGRLNAHGRRDGSLSAGQMAAQLNRLRRSGQIDALFIPEQADAMPAVASALGAASDQDAASRAPAFGTTRGFSNCRRSGGMVLGP